MKSSFLIFLSIALSSCATSQIEIVKATKTRWSPGMVIDPNKPAGGINYEIHLVNKGKSVISPGSLWVNNSKLELKDRVLHQTDTLQYVANYYNDLSANEPDTVPIDHEGEGVISINNKGKVEYISIKTFSKQKPLLYK